MPSHIICISGPEGVGKDSLMRPVMQAYGEQLTVGRKATTRSARDDDFDAQGVSKYEYLTTDEFVAQRSLGLVVEHSQNANGCLYGSYVDSQSEGVEIRDIDVNGALQLYAKARLDLSFPRVTLIGIVPPHRAGLTLADMRAALDATQASRWQHSVATAGIELFVSSMIKSLAERIDGRGDSAELKAQKLSRARWEIPEIIRVWPHVIVNDDVAVASAELGAIVKSVFEIDAGLESWPDHFLN